MLSTDVKAGQQVYSVNVRDGAPRVVCARYVGRNKSWIELTDGENTWKENGSSRWFETASDALRQNARWSAYRACHLRQDVRSFEKELLWLDQLMNEMWRLGHMTGTLESDTGIKLGD